MPACRNSGSVARWSARMTGPMRRRSTSQWRLPGSQRPPARRMISANSCGQRTATMAPSMLNSHGPTRAGRGGAASASAAVSARAPAPGQRVSKEPTQAALAGDGAGTLLRLMRAASRPGLLAAAGDFEPFTKSFAAPRVVGSARPDRPRSGYDAPACSAALVTRRWTENPPRQVGSTRKREPARQQRQQTWRQQ